MASLKHRDCQYFPVFPLFGHHCLKDPSSTPQYGQNSTTEETVLEDESRCAKWLEFNLPGKSTLPHPHHYRTLRSQYVSIQRMDSKHQGPPRRAHSQNLHSALAKAPQEQSLRQETGADVPAPLPYLGGSTDSCTQAAGSRSPRTSSEPDMDARRSLASLRPPGEPLHARVPGASPWGRSLCEPRPPQTPPGARGRGSPGEPRWSPPCSAHAQVWSCPGAALGARISRAGAGT